VPQTPVTPSTLTVIPIGSLPAPGSPVTAIDALGTAFLPARLTKRNGYNAVEFSIDPGGTGSGDYALFKFWPGSKTWRPEGPRGATPTTYDTSTVAGSVPVRVSVEEIELDCCVVLVSGTGVKTGADLSPAEIQEQVR